MLFLGIAATMLSFVPLADLCSAMLAEAACVPEAETPVVSPLDCATPFDIDDDDLVPCSFAEHETPSANLPLVWLPLAPGLPAASFPDVSLSDTSVNDADVRHPEVSVRMPPAMTAEAVSNLVLRLVYDALSDGSVNARAREWRMPLVRMLVEGTPGTDFDSVYAFLLRGFAGAEERAKIRALADWSENTLPPRDAADVYRAETRYWINLGDSDMAVDAAARMEHARPDYAVRACRLRALSYATAGALDKAKAEIARSRRECDPPPDERLELLYLEAWIWLQEGDVESARRNLEVLVSEQPRSAVARKAREVLEAVSVDGGGGQ